MVYLLVGNTALTYACAGGFLDVVKVLLKEGANIEDHNENGHTPLMEAASAGHVEVARVLLEYGAGINTHSNEFKESALTLACYKGACRSNQWAQFIVININICVCIKGLYHENAQSESPLALQQGIWTWCGFSWRQELTRNTRQMKCTRHSWKPAW